VRSVPPSLAYATLPRDILVSVEQKIPGELRRGLDATATGLRPDPGCHSAGQQFAAGGSLRRDRNRAAHAFRARDRGLIDLLRRPNMFDHVFEPLGEMVLEPL
jgi:hypothetical protein